MSNDDPTTPPNEDSERRWIISVAVSSRPDISVDALTSILAESGFVVSGRELGADLNALGYSVENDADGVATVRATPGGAHDTSAEPVDAVAAAPAAPATSVPAEAVAASTADAPAAAEVKDPTYGNILGLPNSDRPAKPLLLIGAGVVAVIIVIIAIIALSGGKNGSDDAVDTTDTTLAGGTTAPGGSTPKPLKAQTTPGLDSGAIIRSGFDKDSPDSLGTFSSRGTWLAVNGKWAVEKGKAVMKTQAGGGSAATLAIAPVQAADLILNVHIPSANGATGLAFRVKDSKNFWMILLSKKYGTLSLLHVVGNRAKQVADAGLIHLPRLDVSLGVKAEGTTITGYLQGNAVLTATDPGTGDGKGFGLAVAPKGDKGQFDSVAFKDLSK